MQSKKIKRKKKMHRRPILLILMGLILLIAIAMTIIFIRTPGSTSQGIPLYSGTTIYRYINPLIAENFVKNLTKYVNCPNNVCIVMFGSTNCPHCHAMYEFFTNNPKYSNIFIALWVDEDHDASELFKQLYDIETSSKVDPLTARGVPQTLIIKNRDLKAVVIGAVKDQVFWDKITELT